MTTAYKIFSGIKKGKSRMMRAQKLNIKMSQRDIEKSVFHCVREVVVMEVVLATSKCEYKFIRQNSELGMHHTSQC